MTRLKQFSFIFFVTLFIFPIFSIKAMNLLIPYDTLIRPRLDEKRPFNITLFTETGFYSARAFDECGTTENVLRIFNNDQNALKMLEGFFFKNPISQLGIRLDANDDGIRGHFNVSGALHLKTATALSAYYFFYDTWSISAHLPIYSMELKNVCWNDQTKNISQADMRVKELLTNDFFANVKKLGNGLDLNGWKRTGIGDITLLFEWFCDFPQYKPLLKNARINWRSGLILPSGLPCDEDKLFAIPFGMDNAFAIPFSVGLDLTLGSYFKAGLDVELTHTFGNTRSRRIKTEKNQTELLLLQKVRVHKDYGLTQRFNLYVEFYKFFQGLSCKVGYQFKKHGEDEIAIKTNAFSSQIANTAKKLEDHTMHHIIISTNYNFEHHLNDDAQINPQLSLFARVPFNGKNIALISTIGAYFSVSF